MTRFGLRIYRWLLAAVRPDLTPHLDEITATVGLRLEAARGLGAARLWTLEVADLLRGGLARAGVGWRQDVRTAVRGVARSPVTAALVALAVAGGVAALTATASVLATVAVDGLPYPDARRLVAVAATRDGAGAGPRPLRAVEWEAYAADVADGASPFEAVGASWAWTVTVGGDGEPRRVPALRVTPGWFETLGAAPARGRTLGSSTDDATVPRAVLSWDFWMDRFGGRDEALGQVVVLDGVPHEVVGVAPRGFEPPVGAAHVFVHHAPGTEAWTGRWLDGVARLAPGADVDAAVLRLTALNDRAARGAGVSTGWTAVATPLHTVVFGDVQPALRLAAAVAGLLFLATVSSTLGLLLTRTLRRRGEFAVRRALGARSSRIARIVALEGLWLSAVGGSAGIGAGLVVGRRLLETTGPLVPHVGPGDVARWGMGVGGGAALVVALLALIVPAGVGGALAGPVRSGRWARALAAGQLALAVVLVATSIALATSLRTLAREPLGFEGRSAGAVRLALPAGRYSDPPSVSDFYGAVVAALEARTDVDAAGAGSDLPLGGPGAWGTAWTPGADDDGGVPVLQRVAAPGWFAAAGVSLLEGRDFEAGDGAGEPRVIVSRTLAAALWPDGSAVGRRMAPRRDPEGPWATVVGVVDDVRYEGIEAPGRPQYYEPHRASGWTEMYVVVRGAAARDAAGVVRTVLADLDPGVPVEDHGLLEGAVARATLPRRLTGAATLLFALGATGVVGVGVVGASGAAVARRRRELALRRAVGAGPGRTLAAALRGAGATAVAGVTLGVLGLWWLAPVTEGLLFGVEPLAGGGIALAAAVLGGTALLAAIPAAWRALAADPAAVLRGE